MKQECVCKPKEDVETINLSKLCPFMFPCGKVPCQDGKECPGRQDVKRHYPVPFFPSTEPPGQPIWVVRESRTARFP
jgi:hypothetical protein